MHGGTATAKALGRAPPPRPRRLAGVGGRLHRGLFWVNIKPVVLSRPLWLNIGDIRRSHSDGDSGLRLLNGLKYADARVADADINAIPIRPRLQLAGYPLARVHLQPLALHPGTSCGAF